MKAEQDGNQDKRINSLNMHVDLSYNGLKKHYGLASVPLRVPRGGLEGRYEPSDVTAT